ncbi:MAG: UDP-N-acetylmuramate dehydrogenase [Oscillospiraceae bacterium]|nr:UDP-N-acetylmuramate dehydrogenase [Oscillospiraceae bacterium]
MYLTKDIYERLRDISPDLVIKEQEPMKNHTSFRIGGPCDLMVCPKSAAELKAVLCLLKDVGIVPCILGGGTNVLVSDEGIRGVVICMKDSLTELRLEDDLTIVCGSGVSMARLANFAADHGLTGLEFAQGIPGTVGGGMFMNAGAYGGELRNRAVRTHYINMDGSEGVLEGDAQGLGYRTSAFQKMNVIITEAVFTLEKGDPSQIRETMKDLAQKRRSKQPLDLPSAGSTFKRPEGHFAGALIERSGLKGFSVGGAMVSPKHAGFVVNTGDATAKDVKELIAAVQQRVLADSGILLEPEVQMI